MILTERDGGYKESFIEALLIHKKIQFYQDRKNRCQVAHSSPSAAGVSAGGATAVLGMVPVIGWGF
jgi:hypothetical protein